MDRIDQPSFENFGTDSLSDEMARVISNHSWVTLGRFRRSGSSRKVT